MQKNEVLAFLKEHKDDYTHMGIAILGLFGSYARDEQKEESDIDILIETKKEFLQKYRGFRAFVKLNEIREELKQMLKKEIDIVDKTGLLQHKNDFILKKTIYV